MEAQKKPLPPKPEELNENNWNDASQKALDDALRSHAPLPNQVEPVALDQSRRAVVLVAARALRFFEVRKKNIKTQRLGGRVPRRDARERRAVEVGREGEEGHRGEGATSLRKGRRQDGRRKTAEEARQLFEAKMGRVLKADDGAAADLLAAQGVIATFAAPPAKARRGTPKA